MPSYRTEGRKHLGEAKRLLGDKNETSLTYCALQLRMAIEAHVYETAKSYADELPERKLYKWQPAALLKELLEIDIHADRSGILSMAREDAEGLTQEWTSIGSLKRMPLKEVSKIYNSLGSYLHLETVIDHAEGKKRDPAKLASLCLSTVEKLNDLYETNLFNLKMGQTSEIECFVCQRSIKRRLNNLQDGDTVITQCGNDCVATYTITIDAEQVHWTARFDDVPCQQPDCNGTVQIWERWAKAGNSFLCTTCNKASELALTLRAAVED